MLNLVVYTATTRQTGKTWAKGTGTVIYAPAQAAFKKRSSFVILVHVGSYPFVYLFDVHMFGASLNSVV